MTRPPPLPRPTRTEIAEMPPFPGLPLERIHVVKTAAEADAALQALTTARWVGFDTESKPVFTKDTTSAGPHVIQLATQEQAFIVQVTADMPFDFVKAVLESTHIVKVGFGLSNDRAPLWRRFGIRLAEAVDLSVLLRQRGYKDEVGLKAAVAIAFGQKLRKKKAVTTSNWGLAVLRPEQLQYAADDAYAALSVFHHLGGEGLLREASLNSGGARNAHGH